jgi:hypothetical protein
LAEATAKETAAHVTGAYEALPLDNVGHWVPEMASETVTDLLLARIRGG